MPAPALLVAARQKFLASAAYADLSERHVIGVSQPVPVPPAPWVTTGTGPDGMPYRYGPGKASINFYLRAQSWFVSETSARFPKLGASVWVDGAQHDPATEHLCREVTEAVITAFDDPPGEQPPTWGPGVYVIRCRWDGNAVVAPLDDRPAMWRADVAFDVETV